jgi:branched-chain amino acid transport system ATP-binding protein
MGKKHEPLKNELPILEVDDIRLLFGELAALSGVSFKVKKGEIFGLIGPNGSGKTCILNCVNGFYRPTEGNIYFQGKRITDIPRHHVAKLGIGRTFQKVSLYSGLTTLENIMAGRHIFMKTGIVDTLYYGRYGKFHQEEMRHREVSERIIDFLEIEAVRKRVVGTLAYGVRKRIELARALALEPKLLLLDEPTSGMNLEEKEDMARFILDINEEFGTTIVLVEHDMSIVMDLCDRILVLSYGVVIATGTPEEIKVKPEVIEAYLGVREASHA